MASTIYGTTFAAIYGSSAASIAPGTNGQLLATIGGVTTWKTITGDVAISAVGAASVTGLNAGAGGSVTGASGDFIALGPNTATAGMLRLPNGAANGLRIRNAANNADIAVLALDSSNDVILGDGNVVLYIMSAGSNQLRFDNTGNLHLMPGNTDAGVGGGTGVIAITNGTAPSSNPTNGGQLYAGAGAGKWRGSSGTITSFGPA